MTSLRLALIATVLLVVAAPAQAAPSRGITASAITTPSADPTYLLNHEDSSLDVTVAGTTSGGDPGDTVDIRCYYIWDLGTGYLQLASDVPVSMPDPGGAGSFSYTGSVAPLQDFGCRLAAVPSRFTGLWPTGFTGPRVIMSLSLAVQTSLGAPYDFQIGAQELGGYAAYASAGSCGVGFLQANSGDTQFMYSSFGSVLSCGDAYPAATSDGARPSIRVDGHPAYLSAAANSLFAGAGTLSGFAPVHMTVSFSPVGTPTIVEDEDIVRCSSDTFPASVASCTSFVPTGAHLTRTIVQADTGRSTAITDTFTSTDATAHALDLSDQEDSVWNQQANLPNQFTDAKPAWGFSWLPASPAVTTPGESMAGPAGPSAIWIDGSSAALDGDTLMIQAVEVLADPPSGVSFTDAYRMQLAFQRTIPAGGSTSLRREIAWSPLHDDLATFAAAALDPLAAPTVTVLSPSATSTTTADRVAVKGIAADNVGIASLTVNGALIGVAPDGHWLATVPLARGSNTISVIARDASGASTATSVMVSSVAGLCRVPRVVGRTLAASRLLLAAAGCRIGFIAHRHRNHVRRGLIVRQSVARGWTRPAGARIAITISSGPRS